MNYITISVKIKNDTGEEVIGTIVVRDGFSLVTFTDPTLARQIYEYDLKEGKDVAFNSKLNAYIQKYEGMKRKEIVKILRAEIEQSGGKITNETEN